MTSVLLITDSERVQRVFRILEREDVLQLRIAATLAQSELGLDESPVELIFAQSRIAGFSSDLALRRLQEGLPAGTRTVLLAVDSQDAAQARKQGKPFFALALDDMTLVDRIRKLVSAPAPAGGEGAAGEAAPAAAKRRGTTGKKGAPRARAGESVTSDVAPVAESEPPPHEPPKPEPPPPVREPITEKPAPVVVEEVVTFSAAAPKDAGEVGTEKAVAPRKRAATRKKGPPPAASAENGVAAASGGGTAAAGAAPARAAAEQVKAPRKEPAKREKQPLEERPEQRPEKLEAEREAEPLERRPEEPVEEPPEKPSAVDEEAQAAGKRRPAHKGKKAATAPVPFVALPQWVTEEPPADQLQESMQPDGEQPAEELPEPGAEEEASSFAEVMRRAAANRERGAAREAARRMEVEQPSPEAPAPLEQPGTAGHWRVEEALAGQPEPLTNGLLRADKARPRWMMPLLVALLLVTALYLGRGLLRHGAGRQEPAKVAAPVAAPAAVAARKSAATPSPKSAPRPPAEEAPAVRPAPSAKKPLAVPARPAPAPAAAAPAEPAAPPRQPPSAAQPAKPGLKTIPPFMAGVRIDPAYGKSHPGWQRFFGARGEYKIYREDGVYRALQIIALPDQSISDEIYQRALLEFGGIDNYFVRSSEKKGSYLVEHGEAKNGIGLTIYRKKKDLSMKGLVIFYR